MGTGIIRAFLNAIFPPRCLVCRRFLAGSETSRNGFAETSPGHERRKVEPAADLPARSRSLLPFPSLAPMAGGLLCSACAHAFAPVESPLCRRCGMVFTSREGGDRICGSCLKSSSRFTMARAAGVYDRTLKVLIHQLKYRGTIRLAGPLGELLFGAFLRFWDMETVDLVVPVPLHRRKMRQRGFNQAALLIRNWSTLRAVNPETLPAVVDDQSVLVRWRWTESQAGLGRVERSRNIRGAFTVQRPAAVAGKRVLLIDDVYTTGATVGECARVLLKAGAMRVDVLTLARAL